MTLTLEDLALAPGSMVLDIGCAGGAGTAALLAQGCRAVGVELEPALLAELRNDPAMQRLMALRGDATALPVAAASVDGACAIEVLEHIDDTDAVLRELRRVLRPGGRACVAVPTGYTERLYARLHPRYVANAEHVHRFDRHDLTRRLEDCGLAVDRVETRNLAACIAWVLHALVRTDADATGRVLQHRWIDIAVAAPIWVARRVPVVRGLLSKVERRIGKSWYFFCVAS
ncbi:MAG: class I SAM-dependent methyltransferase [Microthrixaceae bacterium]